MTVRACGAGDWASASYSTYSPVAFPPAREVQELRQYRPLLPWKHCPTGSATEWHDVPTQPWSSGHDSCVTPSELQLSTSIVPPPPRELHWPTANWFAVQSCVHPASVQHTWSTDPPDTGAGTGAGVDAGSGVGLVVGRGVGFGDGFGAGPGAGAHDAAQVLSVLPAAVW